MQKAYGLLTATALSILGLIPAATAYAQDEDSGSGLAIEEIIVTASGRETQASDLAMNISAIPEDELRRRNIGDVKELIADSVLISAPGNNNRLAESVTVRGLNVSPVNANNIEFFTRSTLAYYLDSTPLPNISYRIKDVARVESLLGPQGTLYGGGSLGGTIRYITNKPDTEKFTFSANTNVYQVKEGSLSHDTDFVVNAPLSDTVAVRASFAWLDDGGFTDRVASPVWLTGDDARVPTPNPSQNLYEDDDWEETATGRLQLQADLTDTLTVNLAYAKQDQTAHGSRASSRFDVGVACEQAGLTGPDCTLTRETAPFQVDRYTVQSVHEEFTDRDFELGSIDFDWDLGFANLHSSTSMYEDTRVGQGDYLNEGYLFYGVLAFIPSVLPDQTNQSAFIRYDNAYEGLVHETRLTSKTDGPLQWIVGLYHTDADSTLRFWEIFPGLDDAILNDYGCCDPRVDFPERTFLDNGYSEVFDTNYQETAIYGELTYSFTDRLDVTFGARFFNWEDETRKTISDYTGFLGVNDDVSRGEDTGESIFKLNASYRFTDSAFSYLTISEGFRRGGTNGFRDDGGNVVADSTQVFEPDSTTNYELGFKGTFLDGDLYFQGNVYLIEWDNTQTYYSQTILGFPLNGTTNGPDAETQGVELALRYDLTDNIGLSWESAFTAGEFVEDRTVCLFEGNTTTACRTWFDGDDLGGAPSDRHNFGIDYYMSAFGGDIRTSFDVRYVGEVQSNRQDQNEPYEFDAYTSLGASVEYTRGPVTTGLWVSNLTNEDGETSFQVVGGEWGYRSIYIRPRTIGLRLSYDFE